ncbi:hypothetical protein T12_16412 [Trichinella patagoniensis]|uniref:Uncharacterized protein n=1 Tax=Trichinella patagoniensis TaxID=990121 RepID=A0A0V1A4R8_9BILA|nr:hypothetical protein T12_16412 [Trichinella patagoniensis]
MTQCKRCNIPVKMEFIFFGSMISSHQSNLLRQDTQYMLRKYLRLSNMQKWQISVFEVVNGIPILLTASNWLYSNARFILILILDDDDEPGHWELAMTNTFIWHKAQSCGRSQLD